MSASWIIVLVVYIRRRLQPRVVFFISIAVGERSISLSIELAGCLSRSS